MIKIIIKKLKQLLYRGLLYANRYKMGNRNTWDNSDVLIYMGSVEFSRIKRRYFYD